MSFAQWWISFYVYHCFLWTIFSTNLSFRNIEKWSDTCSVLIECRTTSERLEAPVPIFIHSVRKLWTVALRGTSALLPPYENYENRAASHSSQRTHTYVHVRLPKTRSRSNHISEFIFSVTHIALLNLFCNIHTVLSRSLPVHRGIFSYRENNAKLKIESVDAECTADALWTLRPSGRHPIHGSMSIFFFTSSRSCLSV